jgi:ABC-type phosphonate transport system ATPase subunit
MTMIDHLRPASQFMTTHSPSIEVRDLTKRYGNTVAVDQLSFEVHRSGRARYRGLNTQNSLSSGSVMTTQLTSPWPMSIRVAPRETRRSTSAC